MVAFRERAGAACVGREVAVHAPFSFVGPFCGLLKGTSGPLGRGLRKRGSVYAETCPSRRRGRGESRGGGQGRRCGPCGCLAKCSGHMRGIEGAGSHTSGGVWRTRVRRGFGTWGTRRRGPRCRCLCYRWPGGFRTCWLMEVFLLRTLVICAGEPEVCLSVVRGFYVGGEMFAGDPTVVGDMEPVNCDAPCQRWIPRWWAVFCG